MKDEWEGLAASGNLEGYFKQLLSTLERMAVVMERFDNVMNPTLGIAEEKFANEVGAQSEEWPPIRLCQGD